MADFDFLDGFDADGDWGFTSVKQKPATESKADSDATKEVVKATADGVGKAVSSVGHVDSHTDNGWKEVLSKVSEAHPASELANQYGKKSVKDTQVDRIIHKHRRVRAGKKV